MPGKSKDYTLLEALDAPTIIVYGNLIAGISLDEEADAADRPGRLPLPASFTSLARIRAYRIYAGQCRRLPRPILLSVPESGTELETPECGFVPGEVRKWWIPIGRPILAFDPSHGNAEDLLEEAATRGISGGIALENPRYANGKLCVDAHIWARISVLGASVDFDERFPICIDVGQPCITVWENGFANLQVCYRAPNQICGKLCVGKYGLEKCWEECVAVPMDALAAGPSVAKSDCSCHEHHSQIATAEYLDSCVQVTVENGKACLRIPYAGDVCVSIPDSIPNGTVAEACIKVCKRYRIPVGAKVTVKVLGEEVACESWGSCDC